MKRKYKITKLAVVEGSFTEDEINTLIKNKDVEIIKIEELETITKQTVYEK